SATRHITPGWGRSASVSASQAEPSTTSASTAVEAGDGAPPAPAWAPAGERPPLAQKYRATASRHRRKPPAEEDAVVSAHRARQYRRVSDAAPALPRGVGRREGSRVLDEHRTLDRLAVGGELPTLHHVQVVGMRRAVVIDEGFRRNTDGVDDERVAVLVMAD